MWFEIIPAFALVVVGIGGPGLALYWTHYLVLGNHFRRSLTDRWERSLYQRDLRLTGNPYVVNGLETIPDKDDDK